MLMWCIYIVNSKDNPKHFALQWARLVFLWKIIMYMSASDSLVRYIIFHQMQPTIETGLETFQVFVLHLNISKLVWSHASD